MPAPADDMTDLDQPVTRRELRQELEAVLKNLATKDDLKVFATKDNLKAFATKDDLKAMSEDLRRHFNTVAESFKADFNLLHDWVEANTSSLAERVGQLETGHGSRLFALETRVTALEVPRSKRPPKR